MGIKESDLSPGVVKAVANLRRKFEAIRKRAGSPRNKEIASRSGYSAPHVSQILNGKASPSPSAAVNIAAAMNATEVDQQSVRRLAEKLAVELETARASQHETEILSDVAVDDERPSIGGLSDDQLGRLSEALGNPLPSEVVDALWALGRRFDPEYLESLGDITALLRRLNDRTDLLDAPPLPVEFSELLAAGRPFPRAVWEVADEVLTEIGYPRAGGLKRRNLQVKNHRKSRSITISIAVDPYERAGHGYDLRAWIRRERTHQALRLEENCSPGEVRDACETLLGKALGLITPVGARDLTIEFFLPCDLLLLGVDQWTLGSRSAGSIGVGAQVISRSLERMRTNDGGLDWQWRHRWKILTGTAREDDVAQVVRLPHGGAEPDGRPGDRSREWEVDPTVACFVADRRDEYSAERVDKHVTKAIDMGVPAGVWCREGCSSQHLLDEMKAMERDGLLADLPKWALAERHEAFQGRPPHDGSALGILWDDPFSRPETNSALVSPVRSERGE